MMKQSCICLGRHKDKNCEYITHLHETVTNKATQNTFRKENVLVITLFPKVVTKKIDW